MHNLYYFIIYLLTFNQAAQHFEHRFVKEGEIIYNQNDPSSYFYGIIEGRIGTFKIKVIEVEDETAKVKPAYLNKMKLSK